MRPLFVAFVMLVCALPVSAQDVPAIDLSGGYSFVRDQALEENFHGWLASVAGHFNPWLAAVGEVGGNYKSIDVLGSDISLSIHSFMGGPRFSVRRAANVTPFFQVLVGGVRGSASF